MRVDTRIIDVDHRHVEEAQPLYRSPVGDRYYRRGIFEHEPDPRLRMPRIDRQVSGASLEDAQYRYDRLGTAREQEGHRLARARAIFDQHVRKPICGFLDLTVCP
nr:hypothetical protein CPGR_04623 [Mycolicibacterium malmesburyense]